MLLEADQSLATLLKSAEDSFKEKSWSSSEAFCNRALEQFKSLEYSIYLQKGDAQFHQEKHAEAARSYLQAYKLAVRLKLDSKTPYRRLIRARSRAMTFNPRAYLVSDSQKIIYCKIPKNACTIFTNMLLEYSSAAAQFKDSPLGPHDFLYSNNQALRITDPSIFQDSSYFKFVILRNPFKRLVSGYLDKFTKTTRLEKMAKDVVREVQAYIGIDLNLERSITFDEFIRYLIRTEDYVMDAHWRPQDTFLSQGLFEFDWVGQFESLGDTIAALEEKFEFSISQNIMKKAKRGHVTQYSMTELPKNLHTMLPEHIRQLSGFPKATQLFTPRLKALIKKRYAKDIAIYSQYFGSAET